MDGELGKLSKSSEARQECLNETIEDKNESEVGRETANNVQLIIKHDRKCILFFCKDRAKGMSNILTVENIKKKILIHYC